MVHEKQIAYTSARVARSRPSFVVPSREIMTSRTEKWVTVVAAAEVAAGTVCAARLRDRDVAIYNVDGSFYATDDVCTHAYARLSAGFLEGHEIECPLHFGRFDVRSGRGLCAPIESDLRTYRLRVDGDHVQILDEDATS